MGLALEVGQNRIECPESRRQRPTGNGGLGRDAEIKGLRDGGHLAAERERWSRKPPGAIYAAMSGG